VKSTLQPIESPFPGNHHLALFLGIAQIHPLQIRSILFTSFLAKHKIDHWEQLVLLEMIDQMRPDILIEYMTCSTARRTESTTST
jgi:hypothetical protein